MNSRTRIRIGRGGYPLHSGSPNRLWFGLAANRVDDAVVGYGIHGHSLLGETKEELASTF
jgi:hypothetical protein